MDKNVQGEYVYAFLCLFVYVSFCDFVLANIKKKIYRIYKYRMILRSDSKDFCD